MLRRKLLHKRGQTGKGFVCHVGEGLEEQRRKQYGEACKRLNFYAEFEGERYCVLHFPGEDKKAAFEKVLRSKLEQKDYDFRGTVFPESTSNFEGFEFEANAKFAGATFIGEADFSRAHFGGEADFSGAHFGGEADFARAKFSGEWTSFSHARFSGEVARFADAQFSAKMTTFLGAYFSGEGLTISFLRAQFGGEGSIISFFNTHFGGKTTFFYRAKFYGEETDFSEAHFSGEETNFSEARFNSTETSFEYATFTTKTVFAAATFTEKVVFEGTEGNQVFGTEAWAWFDRCRIDKPELFTFNSVLLHPGWFINVDVRKVDFTDVKWFGMPNGPKGKIENEIKALRTTRRPGFLEDIRRWHVESPYTLLAQACRRLSTNAEENRDYPLANEFHYWSMQAQRKSRWGSTFAPWRLIWWYWLLSGYGERHIRADLWIVVILLGFAGLYIWQGPFTVQKTSPVASLQAGLESMVYSLGVMTRLAKDIPQSEPTLVKSLIVLEGVLGPFQIALFVLALRRRFMR